LELKPDGKVIVYTQGGFGAARINPDGTLDTSFVPCRFCQPNVIASSEPPASANFQGLWWNSNESGWGIGFAHQDDVIFATWATYDIKGKPLWLSMTATRFAPASYFGTIYQTHDREVDPVAAEVGTGVLTFSATAEGRFAYDALGQSRVVSITPYVFGPQPTCAWDGLTDLALATNYQDLWFASPAGSDPGWGLSLAHQGDTIVVTWFTYNPDGSPDWLYAAATKTEAGIYTGTLYRATGPAFGAPAFDAAEVFRTPVGAMTLSFTDGNTATFSNTWSFNGASGSRPITRFVFRPPGTVCQ